ncbi:MAG: crossover junction endodeoxyribonuclease RuvC [Treponema sp.]|jgi:crossover junction endodeoxyribonuclease RuvC|nr:crossover junction endodeoxyribonuclease RuvC [Treponema sp.]
MAARRIMGVDPGLASTGWGLVEYADSRLRYLAHGCIETAAGLPRDERLLRIHTEFDTVLRRFKPSEAAIETLYFGKNVSSAIAVAEARGVLRVTIALRGVPLREFSPNAIKKAVAGESGAEKHQVQEMLRFLLGLSEPPRPDHAADALGAAICAAHTVGEWGVLVRR